MNKDYGGFSIDWQALSDDEVTQMVEHLIDQGSHYIDAYIDGEVELRKRRDEEMGSQFYKFPMMGFDFL